MILSKLYEISERYRNLEDLLDNPELENAKGDIERSLDSINEEFNVKAENIAKMIKSKGTDIKGLEEEIKRLQDRKKVTENKVLNLKLYLFDHMKILKKEKINGKLFTLSIRKNPPAVNVIDEDAIPQKYKIPQPYKLDKTAILEDLKQEVKIDGVEIKQSTSLSIR
ncbi:siphovirus Gp157 family protein [Clostridium sp. 001]|uniref:siphovirus Gp157 family protein n=1 Tax=Clostridium sp. 001 TaxID=1970093 RepID=UPI001C2C1CFD|nr:siphovirus Gp157 family protein [Clostridium sp. 001]